jgi:Na+-driven multidrug efflux pump
LGDGFLVCLVIVGPTFLFEELWRGRPMIDQPGALWLLPAVLMGIGFFVGGRVAGRNRRARTGAFSQGILVAGLTLGLIFVADMIRRLVLAQPLTWGVVAIWLACAAAALLAGGIGGINGRRGTRLAKKRHQMERFH